MQARVLIVEDDNDIAELIRIHLTDINLHVDVLHDGLEALEQALHAHYDLIVLDIMLPRLDGLEICRKLREAKNYSLVLMLTAKSSEIDRVMGLEIGADDYLTKPFSMLELQARIKALLRRRLQVEKQLSTENNNLIFNDLTIDVNKREVVLAGESLSLTSKEFDLLLQFAKNPGRVYSRAQLLDLVWGFGYDGFEHTVNSHINRLRAKLVCANDKPEFIQTVWGVGYKFISEDASSSTYKA